jgi:hypothetical protein
LRSDLAQAAYEAAVLAGRCESFQSFLAKGAPQKECLVAFNSSFLYRDVHTKKSSTHVAVRMDGSPPDVEALCVIEGLPSFNSQFKTISTKSKNIEVRDVDEALSEQ